MKTNFKRIGKRTISVILSMMMVFSSLFVGTVTTANAADANTPYMYLVGQLTGNNWDNSTKYKIETSYGESGKFYREVSVTAGSTYYFALHNGSTRYAPKTDGTDIKTTSDHYGDYSHTSYSWKYTASANATKVKICVDQNQDDPYWPYVWIEEVTSGGSGGDDGDGKYYILYGDEGQNNPANFSNYVEATVSGSTYTATFPVTTKGTYYLALSSSTSWKNIFWQGDSAVTATSTDSNNVVASKANYGVNQESVNATFYTCKMEIKTGYVKGITITVNGSTKKYTVTPEVIEVPDDAVTVYAMDGIRDLGESSVVIDVFDETEAGLIEDNSLYNQYYVAPGKTITIQTVVNLKSNGEETGYYVYGYNINGETYTATAVGYTTAGNPIYQTEYIVTGDEINNEKSGVLEITPVYFNKNAENKNDYAVVYVDASQLQQADKDGKGWGNMISAYSYYYEGTTTHHGEGGYPGQVMLKDSNGKYFTKIAKYYYNSNGEKTDIPVSGVTFNNYSEENKHEDIAYSGGNAYNYQTYDYNDFGYIAALGYDTIQFTMEYRNYSTSNQSDLGVSNEGNDVKTNHPNIINDFDDHGWYDFLDYDGNKTDILGNLLDGTKTEKIYIVSTGNQDTRYNTNVGQVGQWSTVWFVYDANGNYITQGVPSDFIPRYSYDAEGNIIKDEDGNNLIDPTVQSDAYRDILSNGYKQNPAMICYEEFMSASSSTSSGNTGSRLDGRWYYSLSTKANLPVNLLVQYQNNDQTDDTWTYATTDAPGTASIDNNVTINGKVSVTYTERNKDATLNAVAGTGYVFEGWCLVTDLGTDGLLGTSDDVLTPMNLSSANGTIKIDTEYNIVARFVQVDAGTLILSHEKYLGPDSVGGDGYYYISAIRYSDDSKTSEVQTYNKTESAITIPLGGSTDGVISITLTTTCKGMNKFLDWYELAGLEKYQKIGPEDDSAYNQTGTQSYSFDVKISDLYAIDHHTLLVQSLRYFSDIAPVSTEGKLIYNYIDRFENPKQYVKKIQLTSANYNETTQEYEITDKMIADNAPAIDDLTKDCKWEIASSQFAGTVVTLNGTHKDKTHTAIFVDEFYKGGASHTYKDIPTNTLVKVKKVESDGVVTYERVSEDDEDGEFITAKGDNFLYWEVIDNKTGREVAKCFYEQFVLKIVDDYTITAVYGTELENSVTISAPEFTREQSTDSEGNNVKDYLYADFIIAYMPENGELIRENPDKYETGLILEVDKDMKLSEDDIKLIKADREKIENSLWDVNYTLPESYIEEYKFTSDKDTIIGFAKSLEDGAKQGYKTDGNTSNNRLVYNFEVTDDSVYNNFNRATFYIKFNNTTAYQNYVMKAYYYVHELDANGNIVNTTLSEPIYFNFYLIGTSDQIVVERPSTTE